MWYICMYTYTTVKKFKKKWWALCVRLNHSISRTLISKHSGLIGQIHMQKKKKVKLGLIKEKVWKIFSTHKIFGQTFRCVQAFHCERYLAMQIKLSNFKSVLFVVTQSGSPLACRWISLGAWQTSGSMLIPKWSSAGGWWVWGTTNRSQLSKFWLLMIQYCLFTLSWGRSSWTLMQNHLTCAQFVPLTALPSFSKCFYWMSSSARTFSSTFSAPPVHLKMIHTQNT